MPSNPGHPLDRDLFPWYLWLFRAVPAIAIAVVITFSADHSARFGLVTFGAFALASGLGVAVVAFSRLARGPFRLVVLCQSGVAVVTGAGALALPGGGYSFLVLLLSAYAAISGFLDLYLAARSRGRSPVTRDWAFAGALSVILAVTALVLPSTFSQPYSVEGVEGVVTASVALVGVFGAYLAITGIYLTIAAFSVKWSNNQAPVAQALADSNTVEA